jgi:phosphomannomutase
MELGLQYSEKTGADLLLATDPDCDPLRHAVKSDEGINS